MVEARAGAFISFEGGEGAGKSTQARRLAERLRADGCEVVLTREPGGSPFAERVRTALLGDAGRTLDPTEQAIMFAAARSDHVETTIAPALAAGRWVICDRFADSTDAYQGAAGVDRRVLAMLRRVAAGARMPDLTFVLDVPPEVGLARARSRRTLDGFEREPLAVHEARRAAFLMIAEREPQRCVVIDATADEAAQAERIWTLTNERLRASEDA